jgi:hypothetical protein
MRPTGSEPVPAEVDDVIPRASWLGSREWCHAENSIPPSAFACCFAMYERQPVCVVHLKKRGGGWRARHFVCLVTTRCCSKGNVLCGQVCVVCNARKGALNRPRDRNRNSGWWNSLLQYLTSHDDCIVHFDRVLSALLLQPVQLNTQHDVKYSKIILKSSYMLVETPGYFAKSVRRHHVTRCRTDLQLAVSFCFWGEMFTLS